MYVSLSQAGRSLPPRLVAASKGQPVGLIQDAYDYGVGHFGENYVSRTTCSQIETMKGFAAGSRVG